MELKPCPFCGGEKIQEHLQHHMTDIGMLCSAKIVWHKQESVDKKKMQ